MMVKSLWDVNVAPEKDTLEELRYRSNLIGSDRTVCNWTLNTRIVFYI